MAVTHGPRGLPGNQGLKGTRGVKGDKGDAGIGVTITNNGNGTYTLTGANGSIILKDGKDGATVVGQAGDYLSTVYGKVPLGDAAPTINPGTGAYTGTIENPPTGSVNWTTQPNNEVGYSTYVSTNRYVNNPSSNTWSLLSPIWSTPVIYYVGDKIKNKFVSWIFIRSNSIPIRPTGGSYSNPMPYDTNWSDGIPAGDSPLYASKRLFTEDGNAPQDPQWSEPKLHGGNNEISFRYAENEQDPAPWAENPLPIHNWMVACHKTPNGTWNCDYSKKMKISGESGTDGQSVIYASAFKRSVGNINGEIPEGGNFYNPWPMDTDTVQGWQNKIPDAAGDIYVSNRLFTSDYQNPQDPFWSPARLWSGSSAKNLVLKTDNFVFSYDNEDPPNITPDQIIITAEIQNISDPIVWTSDPPNLVEDFNVIIDTDANTLTLPKGAFNTALGSTRSSVKITATAGTVPNELKDEVTIIKLSEGYSPIPGIDYNDKGGALTHSVYILSENTPNKPTGGSYTGINDPVTPGGADNPNTGKSWLDDPQQITGSYKLWISTFKYIPKLGTEANAPWGLSTQPFHPVTNPSGKQWSTPVEFAYIPREGVDFFSENKFLSYVFVNVASGKTPTKPLASSGSYSENGGEVPPTSKITGTQTNITWSDDPITPADDEVTWVTSRHYLRNTDYTGSNPEAEPWLKTESWSEPSKFSGTSSMTGMLTNETDSVYVDNNNVIHPENTEKGNFIVYFGGKNVITDCSFHVLNQSNVKVSSYTKDGVTLNINSSGLYVASFGGPNSWNINVSKTEFRLVAVHIPTGYSIEKKFSLTKTNQGNDGDDGKDGNDGTDGENAINVILSRPSVIVPTKNDGTVVNSSAFNYTSTTVTVKEGSTDLTYNDTLAASRWKITSINPVNVAGASNTGNTVNNITGINQYDDSGYRTINISGITSKNKSFTTSVDQVITKSIAGADGGGASSIETAATGNVFTGVSVSHPSEGNLITITWQANISSNSTPAPSNVVFTISQNGTILTAASLTVDTVPTQTGWAANTGVQIYSLTPGTGTKVYELKCATVSSGIRDFGYISTKELR